MAQFAKILHCTEAKLRDADRTGRKQLIETLDGAAVRRLLTLTGQTIAPSETREALTAVILDFLESTEPTTVPELPTATATQSPPWMSAILLRQDRVEAQGQHMQRLLEEQGRQAADHREATARWQAQMAETLQASPKGKPPCSPTLPTCTTVTTTPPVTIDLTAADTIQRLMQPYQECFMEQAKSSGSVFRWATAQLYQTHREGTAHDVLRSGVRAVAILEGLLGTPSTTFQNASTKFLLEASHSDADVLKATTVRETIEKERTRNTDNSRSDQRTPRTANTSVTPTTTGGRPPSSCFLCGEATHRVHACPLRGQVSGLLKTQPKPSV